MRVLNNKNTGSTLTADQWNDIPSELQNIITDQGLTLSGGDLNQVGKAISAYVSNGNFYTDGGSANAYSLTAVGSRQIPITYGDGFSVVFIANDTSTGPSTIEVGNLGVKNLQDENGAILQTGKIQANTLVMAYYHAGSDNFRVITRADKGFTDRIEKQISEYVAAGTFYNCSGSGNVYELSIAGLFDAPTSYLNGMIIRCAPSENTAGGIPTVNVDGLGPKNLVNASNGSLAAGEINTDRVFTAEYVTSDDVFRLTTQRANDSGQYGETTLANTEGSSTNMAATQALVTSISSNKMSSFDITGDTGGTATIADGEIVDIAGDDPTGIDTARSGNTITVSAKQATTSNRGSVQLSNSDTSTSTSLAATIASVTRRVKKVGSETISATWTFATNILLNNNVAIRGKTTSTMQYDLIKLGTTDFADIGDPALGMSLKNNGTVSLYGHPSGTPNLLKLVPLSMGFIAANGTFISGINVSSAAKISTGVYHISLSGGSIINPILMASINDSLSNAIFIKIFHVTATVIGVKTINRFNNPVDSIFSFVAYA